MIIIVRLMRNSVFEKIGRDKTISINIPEIMRLMRLFTVEYLGENSFSKVKFKVMWSIGYIPNNSKQLSLIHI